MRASPSVLARALGRWGRLRVLLEVDCGLRRSGVVPAEAPAVARAVARTPLELAGVFTFPRP